MNTVKQKKTLKGQKGKRGLTRKESIKRTGRGRSDEFCLCGTIACEPIVSYSYCCC